MNDLFTLFTSRLEGAGIEAIVTGSVAAMLYGEPRLTHDIDLVVLLDERSIRARRKVRFGDSMISVACCCQGDPQERVSPGFDGAAGK